MNKPIKILFTGDFCPVGRNEELVNNHSVNELFNDILPIIRDSDIAVTNLECPLVTSAGAIKKTGPNLKASINTASFLKNAGINMTTLANNHIMDYGEEGLQSTINACSEVSISHIGAGRSLEEARRAYFSDYEGLKLAFLNFCENEWSTTHGNEAGANPLNPITNHYDIIEARRQADYVFVILHGNSEMFHLPSPRIKELCHFYIHSGANVVICHHSHVYSGYEEYSNGLIFYGLGNFIFDDQKFHDHDWNNGIIVQILLNEATLGFKVFPIRQSDIKEGVRLAKDFNYEEYIKKINEINLGIIDDNYIRDEFIKFCSKKGIQKLYRRYLEPYSNKHLITLYKRGFLPSLITRRKRMLLLNLIRCESHRDVLNVILNK
jgi:poly-gamma-glutamate synthesis protein (capsule biosynthesis protein)